MHIDHIVIQGFKSYKSQTDIDAFSPKHNVVVGRNGSGKSNFFSAIRFVLGDAYTQMGREERQALLHEGSGSAVMTAYVEIHFDNKDQRFPTGNNMLVLRRTIGQKKDEYSLDHKNATKKDVLDMLESAGFSRSNPYYIVPQGRVTALTNMKDPDRLNLLKEVAGTHTYETRRLESKRIMDETDAKLAKIDDLLTFIGDRLGELEEEKEELKGFQEQDREKRCLEYTIYRRDQEDANAKLEELDELQQNGADATEDSRNSFMQQEQELENIDRQIGELQQRIKFLNVDKKQFDDERKAAAREKAKIELDVKALAEGQSAAQQKRTRHENSLREIQDQIQQRETELAEIMPRYNEQKQQETAANAQLIEADGNRQRLYAKQGRQQQFRTKKERDEWLRGQIDQVNMALSTRKAVSMETKDDIDALQIQVQEIESEVTELRRRVENRSDESQSLSAEVQQAADERDRLQDKRKELRREEAKLGAVIDNAQSELQKSERFLSQMMDRNTSQGLAAVRRIVRQHKIEGVYGTLSELFTPTNDMYKTAIEVTAGNSLFHYVVDTDETAARILEIMQREKAGRVTFIPLNRLRSKPMNLPRSSDAVPLIEKLNYEARYDAAFQQVFGKTIVSPTLAIASQYARSHGVGAITPDGDRADKKGALTGGYHDHRRSRLDGIRSVGKWRDDYDNQNERLSSISRECEALDQQITKAISNLQKAEQRRQQTENNYGPLLAEIRTKTSSLQKVRDQVEEKQRALSNIDAAVQQLGRDSGNYETELSSPFQKALTPDEERQLEALGTTVQNLRRQVNELGVARSELEVRKTTIEVELRENLRPRLDQLQTEENESGSAPAGTKDTRLEDRQRELKRADKALADAVARLGQTDTEIETVQTELQSAEASKATKQKEQQDLAVQMHRHQKAIDKSAGRRAMYVNQAEDVAAKIRNLGVLPEAAFKAPYISMKYDAALKRFHKVKEDLKKYGHVNKKAFEQYNQFTRQRESLEGRREDLQTSSTSIVELIETLDQRKDEAIERTFRQVSREFATIFEKLVPAGRGSLKIQRKADRTAEDDESDEEGGRITRQRNSVENYSGVSIQVSFNSKHDEQQKIQQLSGGQKSLCALALVFAIQASDPAPFYLFDEIDANLDAQYCTAVAQMLSESAEHGQFICTTFRPEMLHVADKCYSVGYQNKTSSIDVCSREAALDFIEGQIAGK